MRQECWTRQGSVSCSPWKLVYHDWVATDATNSCMPGCEIILAVTARLLISVCGFCLCCFSKWKPHLWWFLELKKLLKLLQQCWVDIAGPIAWPGRSCGFTPLDIFWSNVTVHIYSPFCILLMEGYRNWTFLRPTILWNCVQHEMLIPFQRFRITNLSHLQGSRCPSRTCLDSIQLAHTGCVLEELTVTELI